MRQHVNPLSSNFNQIERIPSLNKMFGDSKSNLHLDIGCGPGTFLGILNKKSIGIDVSQNQIKYAKKNYSNKKIKFISYKNKLPIKTKFIRRFS